MWFQEYNKHNIKYFAHILSPLQENQGVIALTEYVYCMILLAPESILFAFCFHISLFLVIKYIHTSGVMISN